MERCDPYLDAAQRLEKRVRGGNGMDDSAGIAYTESMEGVVIEPIDWLWPGWLAKGKLHMLAGAPGTGKTTLALWMAAIVSSGSRWPGTDADIPAQDVLLWSGEDTVADVLAPRLLAMGADLSRIRFPKCVTSRGERPFDPATDMPGLAEHLENFDTGLSIIDPAMASVIGDAHKARDVRLGLAPIADLAQKCRCAALGISHFTKGTQGRDPLERVTGSLAFGAICRIVMGAAKMESESGTRRVFCRLKSNLGPDAGGWEYEIEVCKVPDGIETVRIRLGDRIEGDAASILASDEQREEATAFDDAVAFCRSMLSAGRMASREFWADANGAGHSERTMKRAMKGLVESEKEGKVWYLRLR